VARQPGRSGALNDATDSSYTRLERGQSRLPTSCLVCRPTHEHAPLPYAADLTAYTRPTPGLGSGDVAEKRLRVGIKVAQMTGLSKVTQRFSSILDGRRSRRWLRSRDRRSAPFTSTSGDPG
jgi:hypothetical protein